ncbi:hypothetical protein F3Y30_00010 [Sinorhizobium sp. BG8]|nr:hypothetical protein F3Y30_00010 [Sinorhizobium sp. BG8]
MKMLMIASMAAIVASGLWAFASRQVQDGPDPIVVASIAKPNPQKTYSIANAAEHTSCLAQRGEKLSNRSLRFSAGPDCDLVWRACRRPEPGSRRGRDGRCRQCQG